jgi:hypothetical protein
MRQKCLKASLALAGMTLVSAAASVHAASAPCPDPGAICNIQCYNSPYCSIWRACWVTESGIGSAVPSITVGRHATRGWTDAVVNGVRIVTTTPFQES